MWEEINKKQNEDKMLELQYYARKQYNKSVTISEINIAVILISIILEILNMNNIYISGLLFIIFLALEFLTNKCIKNAAKARNIFDDILFKFNITEDYDKIKEKAYRICLKNKRDFEIQKRNTGTDNPPGLKDWYTKNDGKNMNEIILKCQIENTRWDKEITNIDLKIFLTILFVLVGVGIIKYFNKPLHELIKCLFVTIQLVWEIIKRIKFYYDYNKNLSNRECLINEFSNNRVSKNNLISLQKLIEERRKLNLVPLNSIHNKISQKMHDIIKNS